MLAPDRRTESIRRDLPQIAHIDVLDHDDAFVLKAEIAGVDKDKLDEGVDQRRPALWNMAVTE